MPWIADYVQEIREIGVENHTIDGIKRDNWAVLNYPENIKREIFTNDEISLSRSNVKVEADIKTKIMKVLMWGFPRPSGHPPRPIFENIVQHLTDLETLFNEKQNQSLNAAQIRDTFSRLGMVNGLGPGGIAINSKLLYFFNLSFEGRKCLILDSQVVKRLKLFDDFAGNKWKANQACYSNYLNQMDALAREYNVSPEQLELFLFNYQA